MVIAGGRGCFWQFMVAYFGIFDQKIGKIKENSPRVEKIEKLINNIDLILDKLKLLYIM